MDHHLSSVFCDGSDDRLQLWKLVVYGPAQRRHYAWSAIVNRLSTTTLYTPRIHGTTDSYRHRQHLYDMMQNFEPSHMTSVFPELSRRRLPSSQSLTYCHTPWKSVSGYSWTSDIGMDAYTWQSSAYWCRVTHVVLVLILTLTLTVKLTSLASFCKYSRRQGVGDIRGWGKRPGEMSGSHYFAPMITGIRFLWSPSTAVRQICSKKRTRRNTHNRTSSAAMVSSDGATPRRVILSPNVPNGTPKPESIMPRRLSLWNPSCSFHRIVARFESWSSTTGTRVLPKRKFTDVDGLWKCYINLIEATLCRDVHRRLYHLFLLVLNIVKSVAVFVFDIQPSIRLEH